MKKKEKKSITVCRSSDEKKNNKQKKRKAVFSLENKSRVDRTLENVPHYFLFNSN